MAIARGGIFLTPSADVRTVSQLNSVNIESGIYHCNESFTIGTITSSKWTVICMSNELHDGLQCYSQLWITIQANLKPRMFIRSAVSGATSYSGFTSFINCATDTAVDLYIGGTEPSSEDGITKVFIDLN